MIDSICIIVKRPMGEEATTLGIRASYATLMSALETKLLFVGDGIYNLRETSGYNSTMLKEVLKEEGEVYCSRESMKNRGLLKNDLLEGVKVIPEKEVAAIIEECESVAVF